MDKQQDLSPPIDEDQQNETTPLPSFTQSPPIKSIKRHQHQSSDIKSGAANHGQLSLSTLKVPPL